MMTKKSLQNSHSQFEAADGLVVGLQGRFVDEAQRSAASTFSPKKESPNSTAAKTHLFADQKRVALRNEKHFVDTVDRPLITSRGIFRELNGYFGAERYFNKSTIIFVCENEVRHI